MTERGTLYGVFYLHVIAEVLRFLVYCVNKFPILSSRLVLIHHSLSLWSASTPMWKVKYKYEAMLGSCAFFNVQFIISCF